MDRVKGVAIMVLSLVSSLIQSKNYYTNINTVISMYCGWHPVDFSSHNLLR